MYVRCDHLSREAFTRTVAVVVMKSTRRHPIPSSVRGGDVVVNINDRYAVMHVKETERWPRWTGRAGNSSSSPHASDVSPHRVERRRLHHHHINNFSPSSTTNGSIGLIFLLEPVYAINTPESLPWQAFSALRRWVAPHASSSMPPPCHRFLPDGHNLYPDRSTHTQEVGHMRLVRAAQSHLKRMTNHHHPPKEWSIYTRRTRPCHQIPSLLEGRSLKERKMVHSQAAPS